MLDFRPVFITQDQPTGWTPYDMLFDQLNSLLISLGLSPGNVQHGLMMSPDGQTLLGMRFMTIEPASLPLVPDTYDGPTTDYLGVGPKLVRLVKPPAPCVLTRCPTTMDERGPGIWRPARTTAATAAGTAPRTAPWTAHRTAARTAAGARPARRRSSSG